MKKYIKDGVILTSNHIILNNRIIFNPTEEQLIEAGYEVYEPEVYKPTLSDVRERKLMEIEAYNKSPEVDSFKLNGEDTWLTVEERLNYDRSLRAYEELNMDKANFFINGKEFKVSVSDAKKMLSAIQLYADMAYIITMKHKQAIQELDSIEAIETYDYKAGYPDKLEFEI